MIIRQFTEKDSESVKSLFNICFESSSPLRFINPLQTLVAYENDNLVGAAGLRYSELHFRMPAVYIAVSPGYRKKGIGSELHKNLIKLFPLKSSEIGFAGNSYDVQEVAIGWWFSKSSLHIYRKWSGNVIWNFK